MIAQARHRAAVVEAPLADDLDFHLALDAFDPAQSQAARPASDRATRRSAKDYRTSAAQPFDRRAARQQRRRAAVADDFVVADGGMGWHFPEQRMEARALGSIHNSGGRLLAIARPGPKECAAIKLSAPGSGKVPWNQSGVSGSKPRDAGKTGLGPPVPMIAIGKSRNAVSSRI